MTTKSSGKMYLPGSYLGVLGGGQLGRMFCMAAQSMGYKVMVLDPAEHCPAGDVADTHLRAAYDDEAALLRLAQQCVAVTTEFENVPAHSLEFLAAHTQVSPDAHAVSIAQDRIAEKTYFSSQGVGVAPFAAICSKEDIAACPDHLFPGILKSARLGYDGKGQYVVASRDEAYAAFEEARGVACVLEAKLDLAYEVSVLVVRDFSGNMVTYPVSENTHRQGILAISKVPAEHATVSVVAQASEAAQTIAAGLNYHGVLCIEFFVVQSGELVVNEMAPRPHNSGHYTIDACQTSQFEQQARVMAGMPIGSPQIMAPSVMLNILGDAWFQTSADQVVEPDWSKVLSLSSAKLHLYGKSEARPDRKMGHITLVNNDVNQLMADTEEAARALGVSL